ncbi:MAG: lysozyme [Prevotella sp.]|nr:lysozyme [Prevotella sp.]MBO5157266.1 lysozyme [Prevotella sp.]
MTQYKSSETLINAIKTFEGYRLTSYKCPAGVLTIGYGHTKGVRQGMEINESEADKLLRSDLLYFEKYVNNLDICKSQGQFDALVDFSFNLGTAALGRSTLLKYIRAGRNNTAIQAEFRKWVHSGKKVLPGLVKRRDWEAKRWAE